jgi:hypothetical protein
MLPVVLFLRFAVILTVTVILSACVAQTPMPVATAGGLGWQSSNNCPEPLLNPDLYHNKALLEIEQSQVAFYCDLEKDGTFLFTEQELPAQPTFEPTWLLVDTDTLQIEVKRGTQTVATFANIAIGQSGAGLKNQRGDNITPKGEYKIGWVNRQSAFHLFYGLTYPSVADAEQGLQNGSISQADYAAIVYAHQHQQIPPQNTALGGQIGLHGLGQADESIHQNLNWTHGCVAITNSQIDELSQWITTGMRVQIK